MNTRTSDPQSLKALRYLPALRDIDYTKRSALFPLNSSPAKLLATPENVGRKKLDSSSKPQRVASMPKKSPKEDSTFTRTNFLTKNYGKNAMFTSPRNILNRNNKLAKIETPPKPIKNSPPSTADIFNERFQQLQLHDILPNSEDSRCSQKAYGIVKGFGVCTNQGLVRNYNEDRVSIALELQKPVSKPNFETWPNCSIFAIFDGHGGSKCADFLRNHLHYYIIKNKWFPSDPEEALKEACESVEKRFLESQLTAEDGKHDTSGSCGLVMVVVENTCYVCNVGDSRAVISRNGGKVRQAITRDHKPCDESEKARVLNAGGRIYQNFPSIPNSKLMSTNHVQPVAAGPQRILPGGLAVSRAFGDIEAKVPKFGGNMNVLIAKPEITTVKINRTVDFIVMGSDGIFDVMSNDEIIKSVWNTIQKLNSTNIHEVLRIASENIIKEALLKKSFDNVTVTIIGFPALEAKINPSSTPLESSVEMTQDLPLSPKVNSPQKIEVIPEVNELTSLKTISSPPNGSRVLRSERVSPQRFGTTLTKTFSRESSKKDLSSLKLNDVQGKELENFPKIIPRKNGGFRPSRLSAV